MIIQQREQASGQIDREERADLMGFTALNPS
jgi:hypothetical protein